MEALPGSQRIIVRSLTSSRRVILLKGRDNTDHVLTGGDPQGRAMTAIRRLKCAGTC